MECEINMKGFFSSTSVLLAVAIIALAASVALLEQNHAKANTTILRNQILFEKSQDAAEITSAAITQVIAASGKQVQCNAANLQASIDARKDLVLNLGGNENLNSKISDLAFEVEGNNPYIVHTTGVLKTTLDNADVEKSLDLSKKLEIISNAEEQIINVTDIGSGNYKQFTITC